MPLGNITVIDNAPNCKILVVEDQIENRILLAQLIKPYGFGYREAVNGEEGVAITQEWQPHLILMDRRMPVMDGLQATRTIRALSLGLQPVIIAVTAEAEAAYLHTTLVALPPAILEQLEGAASRCDVDRITCLIVPYPEVQGALQPLLDFFRFDPLVDEIGSQLHGAVSSRNM